MNQVRPLQLLMVLLLSGAAGCAFEPWTDGEKEEAYRLCRAEIGFPPISVFHTESYDFEVFMCRCEVGFLADRVAHPSFADGQHVLQVNGTLQMARSTCLMRHKDGER